MKTRWISYLLLAVLLMGLFAGCETEAPETNTWPESIELLVGDTVLIPSPAYLDEDEVQFTSTAPDYFTVSETGAVYGLSGGEGNIVVSVGETKVVIPVTVQQPEQEDEEDGKYAFTVGADDIMLEIGDTYFLQVNYPDEEEEMPSISFESGAPEIASVDEEGEITGVAAGETSIVVSVNGNAERVLVTVVESTQEQEGGASSRNPSDPSTASASSAAGGSSAGGTASSSSSSASKASDKESQEKNTTAANQEMEAQKENMVDRQEQEAQKSGAITSKVDVDAYARKVVALVNKERAAAGVPELNIHSGLMSGAATRAEEIVILFSHTRPGGGQGSAFATSITNKNPSGENIAKGDQTPEAVVAGWMNSSGHRANILADRYTDIGVGCYQSGGTLYWVQLFSGSGQTSETYIQLREDLSTSTLNATDITLEVGETYQLSVILGGSSDNVTLKWEGDSKCSVTGNGLVTATASGEGTVNVGVYLEDSVVVFLRCNVHIPKTESESSSVRPPFSGNALDVFEYEDGEYKKVEDEQDVGSNEEESGEDDSSSTEEKPRASLSGRE